MEEETKLKLEAWFIGLLMAIAFLQILTAVID